MAEYPVVHKRPGTRLPNLPDYETACRSFDWEAARRELSYLPGGRGLNIAYEAVDRHAASRIADKTAIRWLGRDDRVIDISYSTLQALTNRFANVLDALGVLRGDRVVALTGRIPELYVTALGALKHRAVFSPLFSAFGPEPVKTRLAIAGARVLVTTTALYQRKVAPIRDQLPSLEFVLIVDCGGVPDMPGTFDFQKLMAEASDDYVIQPTPPEESALLHFTSGTTGTPKGAVHVHEAVVAHHITGKLALDLHPDDIFWCTADPGWVTGTSYGIIAPLTNGVTSIVDEAEFDAERWYRILDDQRVTRLVHRADRDPDDDAGRR